MFLSIWIPFPFHRILDTLKRNNCVPCEAINQINLNTRSPRACLDSGAYFVFVNTNLASNLIDGNAHYKERLTVKIPTTCFSTPVPDQQSVALCLKSSQTYRTKAIIQATAPTVHRACLSSLHRPRRRRFPRHIVWDFKISSVLP